MTRIAPPLSLVLGLVLCPLLPGVIDRVKSFIGGRRGRPLFQRYFDLARLARKGTVYSRTTTAVFRIGPAVHLGALAACLLLVPFGGYRAPLAFSGDFLVLLLFLALARMALVLPALDTGSSFEGMGASREAAFGALTEPVLLLALLSPVRLSGSLSLSDVLAGDRGFTAGGAAVIISAGVLFGVALIECARIPIDDPNTHLELTMIHEAMILDHSGPDLGFLLLGSWLKLWLLISLAAGLLLPGKSSVAAAAVIPAVIAGAAAIGIVESVTARWPLRKVPHFIAIAGALAVLALALVRP